MKQNKILPSRNSDCYKCSYYRLGGYDTCPAFYPEQIPIQILNGKQKHRKPIAGQNDDTVFLMKNEFFYAKDECVIVTE